MNKISVVVPVYNTEKYVERCINSMIGQTYTDWELVLVDDGSTDASGAICDRFSAQDVRIKVLHKENAGPNAARKAGVEGTSGELLMFVDSDDWIEERMLEALLSQMQESGADIVCSFFKNINEKGEITHAKLPEDKVIDCNSAEEGIYQMHHTRYLTGSPCTKLIRRELLEKVDFCQHVTIGEDYALIVQLVEKARKVRILSEELYFRFVRKGSISHGGFTERHKEAFDNYMKIRLALNDKYPKLASDITAFHTEYEMAVITAMCRNDCYDQKVIGKLKDDLQKNMKNTLYHPMIPLYMKGCAILIAYAHPVFIFLFRILYHLTGR